MNFNIHGIRIQTDRKYLFPDYFSTDQMEDVDLRIDRESYKRFDKSIHEKLGLQFWGGKDNIFFESAGVYRHLQKILISDLHKKTTLSFRTETDRHGITTLIKTLFQYKLLQKGKILIHGAALEKDGKAYVFSGWPRTGKSSTVLHLAEERGYNVIGDDMVILSKEGKVYSFPKKAGIFYKSGHFSALNKREKSILLAKYLGVKLFPPLHSIWDRSLRVDLDRLVTVKDKAELEEIYVLRKSEGKEKEKIGEKSASNKVLAHVLNIFYHNPFIKRLLLAYSLLNDENPVYFEEKTKQAIKNAFQDKKYYLLRDKDGNFERCL